MKQFTNKIVLITGGNSGIGLATALRFADEGATVIVTARSEETFAKATKDFGNKLQIIKTDVSQAEDVRNLMTTIKNKYGHLDAVFANAGISIVKPTVEFDDESYDKLFDTNVKGVFNTVRYAIPLLKDGSSVIVNASQAAHSGFSGVSVYGATKGAVLSLVRHWAAEFSERRIRFNSVSPGLIDTPIIDKIGLPEEGVQFFKNYGKKNPAGRLGESIDVANAVLFLASEQSSYVNAFDIALDGGGKSVPSMG
jgi:NAD(P)-dependent dehydrogenase (short-subunit alcohol dehydrogenase family)